MDACLSPLRPQRCPTLGAGPPLHACSLSPCLTRNITLPRRPLPFGSLIHSDGPFITCFSPVLNSSLALLARHSTCCAAVCPAGARPARPCHSPRPLISFSQPLSVLPCPFRKPPRLSGLAIALQACFCAPRCATPHPPTSMPRTLRRTAVFERPTLCALTPTLLCFPFPS